MTDSSTGTSPDWSYTRHQRNGLFALVGLLGLVAVAVYLLPAAPAYAIGPEDRTAFLAAAEAFRRADSLTAAATGGQTATAAFPFDPNRVTAAELQRLGLSAKQAAAVIKYRQRAPFRRPEDLRKLFVLRPEQADKLVGLARMTTEPSAGPAGPADDANEPVVVGGERFPFDPNTVPADSLRLLGLTERETAALLKYRSYRPVTFRRPEDLLRVNALRPALAAALVPLVDLASAATGPAPALRRPDTTAGQRLPPREVPTIDVNRATTAEWQQLPGIGAYRAGRLLKFRELLGGFADVDQVGTAYGLPDSTFRDIRPYLRAGPIYRHLDVNAADATTLARHPYLPAGLARTIVRFRENHGPFAGPDDLKKVRALTEEDLARLLPYLKFNP